MSDKTKRLLYILLCVAALGILSFLFITETPEDMRTLGKFAVVTAGIVLSLGRTLMQGSRGAAERETLYRESYYRRAVANGVDGKELSRFSLDELAKALTDMDANA